MHIPPPYHPDNLMQRIAAGDEQAFRQLYDHYRNKVLTIAHKVLHSETEVLDALQEVFVKIWINRATLPDIDNFNAYLNTITRNHLCNMLRRRLYEKTAIAEIHTQTVHRGHAPEDEISRRQLHHQLQTAIGRLPVQQKKVFELSRLEGLKQDDIAARLQISRETVKRHLSEASRKLRNMLEGYAHLFIALISVSFLK